MTRIEFSARAQRDVVDIADRLSDRSIADALHFVDAVERATLRLATWPMLGHQWPELGDPSLRTIVIHDHYHFVYRHADAQTWIVRVLDARTNPASLREALGTED